MDFKRLALMGGLGVVSFMLLLAWDKDKAQTIPAQADNSTSVSSQIATSVAAQSDTPIINTDTPVVASADNVAKFDTISITTDVLTIEIDLATGDVVLADMLDYPVSLNAETTLALLENINRTYIAQSGVLYSGADITRTGRYTSDAESYELNADANSISVSLEKEVDGFKIRKTYTLSRGAYDIDVTHNVTNLNDEPVQLSAYAQIKRDRSDDPSSVGGAGMRSFLGFAFNVEDDSYKKLKFKDMDKSNFQAKNFGGWVAFVQHYFVSAWVPSAEQSHTYYTDERNGYYYGGFHSQGVQLTPNTDVVIEQTLYAGPKLQNELAAIAKDLNLVVDYGWLWWIAQPIFKLMSFIQGFVGNWGWTIIALTLTIRLALFPLSASSYRSMAKMRKFAPQLAALKEQYGDDRAKVGQETMKLYQKEKINPLGGCFPMLLQMPIFIALYWVLMESVGLRQAPFMFWIHDLSAKDPFFILPLLMGASMWLQMRLGTQPTDPTQAKVMQFMPVIFTVMFLFFPSGLVLYWLMGNIISISQQAYINKKYGH